MRYWKWILASVLVGLLSFTHYAVYRFGELGANIHTGSPAFFTVHTIIKRLEMADEHLLSDLIVLEDQMDPKNASGVNGDALVRFVKKWDKGGLGDDREAGDQ